jgi:hypothetical protein
MTDTCSVSDVIHVRAMRCRESIFAHGWLAFCATVGACGPAIPPLPSQGGPPWIELTSAHFTVWTDASQDRARELVSEMEHLRQVIIGTAFQGVASNGNILVIAFRNLDEFHAYYADRFLGSTSYAIDNLLHQPLIQMSAVIPDGDERRLEAHELSHVISHVTIPRQPLWFAEGLAMFVETIRIDEQRGTVELGRLPEWDDGKPMRMQPLLSLPTLFACERSSCVDHAFYRTSWTVFTYLKNMHAEQLAGFEQRIAGGRDWRSAWEEAFPQLSVATLDQELRTWLRSGSYSVKHFKVQFRDYPAVQRTLSDADVHALRGLLAPIAEELVEIAAAKRLDPTHVLANVLANFHEKTLDTETARAIATAHSEDWRAWWLLAIVLRSGDEAEQAAGKACRLAASNPAVWLPDQLCARTAAPGPASSP